MLFYCKINLYFMGDGIMKKNKFISILLAVVLVITLVPVSGMVASAETDTGTCGENLIWTFEDGVLTISGTGEMTNFVSGKTAGWVEKKYKSKIEKLIINEGVTTIGKNAFAAHSKLASVQLPQSLVLINDYAFQLCWELTEFTIPDGVTNIGNSAFNGCKNLRTIQIGAGLEKYGNQVFDDLNNLSRFVVSSSNNKYSSDTYGVLYDKEKTKLLICPAQINVENYEIPDTVTTINAYAFENCTKLKSIVVGDNVKMISQWAFYGCSNLNEITVPVSVTSIGKGVFADCNKLTDVHYAGTEEEWRRISIGENNTQLDNATIHYGKELHTCLYNESDWVIEKYPTCVADGVETVACVECGEKVSRSIEATGIHDYENWQTNKQPTCTEKGKESRKCKWCEKNEERDIDKLGHSSGEWETLVEATCIKTGKKVKRCIVCSTVLKEEQIEKTDHKYGKWYVTKQPTANETGIEECKCSVCGNTKQRVIPELGNTAILLGDVNGDGKIAATDARLILQFVAGLKTEKDLVIANADVNKDGKIAATDARMILQIVAGLI